MICKEMKRKDLHQLQPPNIAWELNHSHRITRFFRSEATESKEFFFSAQYRDIAMNCHNEKELGTFSVLT